MTPVFSSRIDVFVLCPSICGKAVLFRETLSQTRGYAASKHGGEAAKKEDGSGEEAELHRK